MLNKIMRYIALSLSFLFMALAVDAAPKFDSVDLETSDLSLGAYQQIYIAPVSVNLKHERKGALGRFRAIQPVVPQQDKDEKAAHLHQTLTRQLSKTAEIVNVPGPGILTIAPTLYRLTPSRLTLANRAARLDTDFNGSVTAGGAEIEFQFSEGKEPLGSLKDRYQSSLNDGSPRVGFWDDADDAFALISQKLYKFVENN